MKVNCSCLCKGRVVITALLMVCLSACHQGHKTSDASSENGEQTEESADQQSNSDRTNNNGKRHRTHNNQQQQQDTRDRNEDREKTRKQSDEGPETVFYEGKINGEKYTVKLTFNKGYVNGYMEHRETEQRLTLKGVQYEDGNIKLSAYKGSKVYAKLTSTRHRHLRKFVGDYTRDGETSRFRFRRQNGEDDGDVDELYE